MLRGVVVIVLLFFLSANTLAQQDLSSVKISINVENKPLRVVIALLSEKSGIEIFYNDEIIPPDLNITINESGTVREILTILLMDLNIDIKTIKKKVVLVRSQKKSAQKLFILNGYIQDEINGEELPGATILMADNSYGIASNHYGFFSIALPPGKHEIIYSYVGYNSTRKLIDLRQDIQVNIQLKPNTLQLEELVVNSGSNKEMVDVPTMSKEKLTGHRLKGMPALLGEPDVIRSLLIMPGVQSVGEGKTGLYVRGSRADQTLIQLDEATVFNAFHVGGLFSVFNPDAIKNIELFKGGIPVRYGGRSSSVLDIRMKEGNKHQFSGSGGWGTIASRLTLEGPIRKKNGNEAAKGSFIISGRRTYLDLLLKLSNDPDVNNNTMFFYDLNTKVNYRINDKNRVYLSAYTGQDVFSFEDEVNLNWGNITTTLRWNHLINSKTFVNTTFLYSNFKYGFRLDNYQGGFDWDSNLKNYSIKVDYSHYKNPTTEVNFGYSFIWHHFSPAKIDPVNERIIFNPIRLTTENALEQGIYFAVNKDFNAKLALNAGMRISMFHNLGPGEYLEYANGMPRTGAHVVDTIHYNDFDLINGELGIEPRITVRYSVSDKTSLKASYNRNKQYLHVFTTNNIGFPGDRYKPSDPHIKPQVSNQWTLGYFSSIGKKFLLTAEIYYRHTSNLPELTNEPNAVISSNIEQQISLGKGWSYGLELALRKNLGKTTGWLSYTWSKAWNKIPGLNGGNKFHPFYDRTHDINLVLSHQLNKRINVSANWVYSSGQAISLPIGRYVVDGKNIPRFDDHNLNGDRGPAYHRLDLSMTLKGKNKKNRKWHGSWNFALYNIYFRKNAIGIQYRDVINGDPNIQEDDQSVVVKHREFKAVSTYLFQFVPSITYNFKF